LNYLACKVTYFFTLLCIFTGFDVFSGKFILGGLHAFIVFFTVFIGKNGYVGRFFIAYSKPKQYICTIKIKKIIFMKTQNYHHHPCRHRTGFVFGIVLILAGLLFFLFNANMIKSDLKPLVFSWQMLIIVIGFCYSCKRLFLWGLFVLIAGVFFIIPKLALAFPETFAWVKSDFISVYWSLLIVLAGLLLIVHRWIYRHRHPFDFSTSIGKAASTCNKNGLYERTVVFGGAEEIFLEPVFKGGKIEAVFGGVQLDLRKTTLPEGISHLEVNSVFGGVTLIVPRSWKIELQIDSVFGGASDSRRQNETETDETRKLVVSGGCVFGGCDITEVYLANAK
jgi:predicted membrane protein